MGYRTRYHLETDAKPDSEIALAIGVEVSKHDLPLDERVIGVEYRPDGSAKWYEHETFMLVLSDRFPTVLFTLRGAGEEPGDLWRKYFKAGKMQVAKAAITYLPCTLE